MDMLEESLLVFPDLYKVLAVAIELSQLSGIDLKHNYNVVVGTFWIDIAMSLIIMERSRA